MKDIKGPLILVAVVIVLRIILEEGGIAPALHNVLGTTWLLLLVPIYLGWTVGKSAGIKPAAVAAVGFVIGTRFMVMLTYCLAWLLDFGAFRFSVAGGGNVGEGVSALQGLVMIPVQNFLLTVVIFGVFCGLVAAGVAWIARR